MTQTDLACLSSQHTALPCTEGNLCCCILADRRPDAGTPSMLPPVLGSCLAYFRRYSMGTLRDPERLAR